MIESESEFVADFFAGQTGRFLEIGADDGAPGSPQEPCWNLLESGWSGVYVEPNPLSCAKLSDNTEPYKNKVRIYNMAISITGGIQPFYACDTHPYLSSLDEEWIHFVKRAGMPIYNDHKHRVFTNTVSLRDFITEVGTDFDCISIDVELNRMGLGELVNSIEWNVFENCKLLLIEGLPQWSMSYIESFGFKYHDWTKGTNVIFTR